MAAPLAFVGNLTSPGYAVLVGAQGRADDDFFANGPQAFTVRVDIGTSDGVRAQRLASTSGTIVIERHGTGHDAIAVIAAAGAQNVDSTSSDGALLADVTAPECPN